MSSPKLPYVVLRLAIGTLLLAIGLRTWLVMGIVAPVVVSGNSMAPTLEHGDPLWIDRTVFQRRLPQRWEVVVARNPTDGTELCVKRIVGLPGEIVSLRGGQILINGQAVSQPHEPQPFEQPGAARFSWQSRQWQLGPNDYFLLGDNPPISLDSRLWGPVPGRFLLGKPLGVR